MYRELTAAGIAPLVFQVSLMTNLIYRYSNLYSFRLVRDYSPAIAGIPSTMMNGHTMKAYIMAAASRAIQQIITSRLLVLVKIKMLIQSDKIWVFYTSSKHTKPVQWLLITAITAKEHFPEYRRPNKAFSLRVAYEQIQIDPSDDLATNLVSCSLQNEIGDIPSEELITLGGMIENRINDD